tara:strand:- start:229 stop:633 length:405 start_codon:yes stop_codon:yes gene_type:complete
MSKFNYSKYYNKINSSKLLYGLGIIILNLFSKYVEINISKSQQAFIRNSITRELFIFTVIFVGTHDIITSILLTAALLILSNTAFNGKSKFCIMPEKYKNLDKVLDTNNDNYISEIEIENARDILYRASLQKQN